MTIGKLFAIFLTTALMIGADPGRADEPSSASQHTSALGAAQFVETLGNEAVALLAVTRGDAAAEREDALKDLIRQSFNLELTSQFVLGKYWNQATPEQRAEFQDLFTQYLLESYARHLGAFQAETLSIVGSTPVGEKDVLVETSIRGANGEANPVWRVRAQKGEYRIIDVSVDGVSLALTQRREFASVVSRHGLEGLLRMLREKVAAHAQTARWPQRQNESHASLLASILLSPNANTLGILLAQR